MTEERREDRKRILWVLETLGRVGWRTVNLDTRKWARSLCWGGDCIHAQDRIRLGPPDIACTHCHLGLKMPRRHCPYYEETEYVLKHGG